MFSNLFCDQVLIAKSEDELQEAANTLNKIVNNVRWTFQKQKKKWQCVGMTVRVKIELNRTLIEQVSEFK